MSEHIIKAEFSEVMQKSYIDYAMSVICARALPDARWIKASTEKSFIFHG